MKLDNYQMLEAFHEENWRSAIAMLRQHFCLESPPHLCYEVLEHEHHAECVEIRQDNVIYYWHECDGFTNSRKLPTTNATLIYCRPP
jgi:hypothetical protein